MDQDYYYKNIDWVSWKSHLSVCLFWCGRVIACNEALGLLISLCVWGFQVSWWLWEVLIMFVRFLSIVWVCEVVCVFPLRVLNSRIKVYKNSSIQYTCHLSRIHNSYLTQSSYFQNKDETTMLVLQVYSMCTIGPLRFKWAQLVSQVLKMSCISFFINCC